MNLSLRQRDQLYPQPNNNTTLQQDIECAVQLPKNENILHFDYRSQQLKDSLQQCNTIPIKPLKICQWNIERGIKLDLIIDILRQNDADIIALQEIDCGLSRSEYIETGIAIAKELGLNYVFQREFIELEGDIDKKYFFEHYHSNSNPTTTMTSNLQSNSSTSIQTTTTTTSSPLNQLNLNPSSPIPISELTLSTSPNDDKLLSPYSPIIRYDDEYQSNYRKSKTQLSTTNIKHNPIIQYHPTPIVTTSTYKYKHYAVQSELPGCHGNCILTKFDIKQIFSIEHDHHPYNWNDDGHLLNEPRIGARRTLCCVINVPKYYIANKIATNPNQDVFYIVDGDDNNNNNNQSSNISNNQQSLSNQHDQQQSQLQSTRNQNENNFISIPVYTCHLELFCGLIDRLKILSELFAHYRTHFHHPTIQFNQQQDQQNKQTTNQSQLNTNLIKTQQEQSYGLILGDFTSTPNSSPLTTLSDSSSDDMFNTNNNINPYSFKLSSENDNFIIYPIVQNQIDGYYERSSGLLGWIQRNCTEFVQYSLTFVIPTIFAILYVLLYFDQHAE